MYSSINDGSFNIEINVVFSGSGYAHNNESLEIFFWYLSWKICISIDEKVDLINRPPVFPELGNGQPQRALMDSDSNKLRSNCKWQIFLSKRLSEFWSNYFYCWYSQPHIMRRCSLVSFPQGSLLASRRFLPDSKWSIQLFVSDSNEVLSGFRG